MQWLEKLKAITVDGHQRGLGRASYIWTTLTAMFDGSEHRLWSLIITGRHKFTYSIPMSNERYALSSLLIFVGSVPFQQTLRYFFHRISSRSISSLVQIYLT
jgi:hypothetical protein